MSQDREPLLTPVVMDKAYGKIENERSTNIKDLASSEVTIYVLIGHYTTFFDLGNLFILLFL